MRACHHRYTCRERTQRDVGVVGGFYKAGLGWYTTSLRCQIMEFLNTELSKTNDGSEFIKV